jgi:ubiquitin carboxyl-terminal hydrolase 8
MFKINLIYSKISLIMSDDAINKKILVNGISSFNNIGNTCYLNAALQCLMSTDMFINYFFSGKYRNDLKKNILKELVIKYKKKINISNEVKEIEVPRRSYKHKFKKSLSYLIRNIINVYWRVRCSIKPEKFKMKLGILNPRFLGAMQNDSEEVINLILDTIHEECKKKVIVTIKLKEDSGLLYKSLLFWKSNLESNYSIVTSIFTGLFLMEHKCLECQTVSCNFETFNMISLPIPEAKSTLEECLTKFIEREQLTDINQYSCDICKKKTNGEKTISFWKLPPRLIIQFKRYNNHKSAVFENKNTVMFPINELDMSIYINKLNTIKSKYKLYAVIQQFGGIRGGHYIAYTRNLINDEWYKYDDETVTHIYDDTIESEIVNGNTYILFYKLV